MSRSSRAPKSPTRWLGAATVIGLTAATFAALMGSPAQAIDWSACLDGSSDTQAVFERAADVSGVPEDVLLAVGYLGSRWSQHDGAPSTSGGYGVMHLTDFAVDHSVDPAKGDSRPRPRPGRHLQARARPDGLHRRAGPDRPRRPTSAAGAAVLASYQPDTASQAPATGRRRSPTTPARPTRPRWCSSPDRSSTCCAAARPRPPTSVTPSPWPPTRTPSLDRAGLEAAGALEPGSRRDRVPRHDRVRGRSRRSTCRPDPANPKALRQLRPRRPRERRQHRLPGRARHRVRLRRLRRADPDSRTAFVSWHYTIRSADGHVAQHVATHNVAAHAGNWYINMHSVGVEHEGYAAGPGRLVHRGALPLVGRR